MPKLKNSNATFSVIFKQYVTYYRKVVCINDEKYLRKDQLFGMWLRTTSLVLRGRGPKSSLSWKQERCIQAPSLNPHCDDHFFRSHLHKKWMIWLHKDSKFTCVKAAKIGFRTLVLVIILEMRGMCVFNRPQQQSHKKRWFSWDNHLEWMPSVLKN